MTTPLRIGTRASELARWQASRIQALLAVRGQAAELVVIRTGGDAAPARRDPRATGKGLFTKEIEDALLAGTIDLAVHSLKDLPTEMPHGLRLAAFPERADPRDALVSRWPGGVEGLPVRATVGTSSLRRRAALLAARGDLEVVALRGNVPTRVQRVGAGVDAAVLALAGLERLGLHGKAVALDSARHVPAPGQGALAVEVRADDRAVLELVRSLDDSAVRHAVVAERAALATLEGGCQAAVGALSASAGNDLVLHVRVYAYDGSDSLATSVQVDRRDPAAAGREAGRQLLGAGAARLITAGSLEGFEP